MTVCASDSQQALDRPEKINLNARDRLWMLSIYGTAIGAGTLFLPIAAGIGGLLPILFISVIIFPMTFYSHRALCRFFLVSASNENNLTATAKEYFGNKAGNIITVLYFLSVYPILLMYSVAITNTFESFLVNQCAIQAPPRSIMSLGILLLLLIIIRVGQHMILKSMTILVYPFITLLLFFSVYLIPHWHLSMLCEALFSIKQQQTSILYSLYILIPTMVFAFNHIAIISTFAKNQRHHYGEFADQKTSHILKSSQILMILTVMFFVFSCVLTLTPMELAKAKAENISILSYLANEFQSPAFVWLAPIVAFMAIAKSFFGHYIGASEGLTGLVLMAVKKDKKRVCHYKTQLLVDFLIIFTCWLVATINPGILTMIETVNGPIVALMLFLLPMYALIKVPALQKYRSKLSDTFVTLIGFTAFSAIIYRLF
jgi:serine transporter